MSDLASAARLRQASPQLPASWYSDSRVFDAERKLLFPRAPGYVGHALMVPEPGDYYALPGRTTRKRWFATWIASSFCRTFAVIDKRSCCRARATRATSSVRFIAGLTISRVSCWA